MIEQSRHTGFPVYVQLNQKLCLRQESAGNTKSKLSVLYSIIALIFGTPHTFVAELRSLFCWRKMIWIGYNKVNKAHNRYSPLSPATSTFRLLFMENWIHEEQMFRNTTWFASLRNTLSPIIMLQWKTTPNERVQLLLETSHVSLNRDCGRKGTCWTKTHRIWNFPTNLPLIRSFTVVTWRNLREFFKDSLSFKPLGVDLSCLFYACTWTYYMHTNSLIYYWFMTIHCFYISTSFVNICLFILRVVYVLYVYFISAFSSTRKHSPLASRVWTTLQLERLLVRSSTVLDKFSVFIAESYAEYQAKWAERQQSTSLLEVARENKMKSSGMYGIVKLYSTIYYNLHTYICNIGMHAYMMYLYCNHLIYVYAYHISKCWWWRLRSYWFIALLLRWSFCCCFSVTWPWTWVCFFFKRIYSC